MKTAREFRDFFAAIPSGKNRRTPSRNRKARKGGSATLFFALKLRLFPHRKVKPSPIERANAEVARLNSRIKIDAEARRQLVEAK